MMAHREKLSRQGQRTAGGDLVCGERVVVPPLLDRDEAERIRDLGVVAVVEAALVTTGGGLDLLEQRNQIVPPVGARPEACDDDEHGDDSISVP
jgi:hypothetical protein